MVAHQARIVWPELGPTKKIFPVTVVPADWNKEGKSAGAIRNQHMLDMKPDGVVAFPGGAGTSHMIKIAKEAAIPVRQIK